MEKAGTGKGSFGAEVIACGVHQGDLSDGLDGASVGTKVANDEERSTVRHAVEVAAFVVSGEAKLIGTAWRKLRKGCSRGEHKSGDQREKKWLTRGTHFGAFH